MEFCNLYLELVLPNVMLQIEKFLHCFQLSRLVEILSSKQFWKLFFYLHTFISFLPQILWQTILLELDITDDRTVGKHNYTRGWEDFHLLWPQGKFKRLIYFIHTSKYCWMPKWIWAFSSYNFLCSTVGCWTTLELLLPL